MNILEIQIFGTSVSVRGDNDGTAFHFRMSDDSVPKKAIDTFRAALEKAAAKELEAVASGELLTSTCNRLSEVRAEIAAEETRLAALRDQK